jgi:Flp pilus assembly protein TadG
MRSLFNRRDGAAAVEMALLSPLFALLLVGFYDYGSYLVDASAVEKGLRAGAMLAARSTLPLGSDATTRVNNVVKKGNVAGTGNFVVNGWSDSTAALTITTRSETVSGQTVQVVRLQATVPYKSFAEGLLTAVGLPVPTISAVHEQAYVGA